MMRWLSLGLLFSAACDLGEVNAPTTTGFAPNGATSVFSGGDFYPLAPYQGIEGQGYMVRLPDETTQLNIFVAGLDPDLMYTAHLHVAPCGAGGGGHYKIDPSVAGTVEANELWLRGMTTPIGTLYSQDAFAHVTRPDAKSIVVHDPNGGAKMACADLDEL